MSTPQYQPQYPSPYQQQPGYGAGVQPPQGTQPGQPMGFAEAVKDYFRKYAQFSGRASRSQYWWPALTIWVFNMVLLAVVLTIVIGSMSTASPGPDGTVEPSAGAMGIAGLLYALMGLVGLATFLPSLAVAVRRLHDTDRSGWWYLIVFVPIVGPFILLVFMVMGPDPRGARFDA